MTSLIRYREPFDLMRRWLSDDDFWLSDVWNRGLSAASFQPRFDFEDADDAYYIRADMPGVDEEDIDVTVAGDTLVVTGKRDVERRDEGSTYHRYERSFGRFQRSFTLPGGADLQAGEASLDKGVLTIRVPKKAEYQPKKIPLRDLGNRVKGLFGKRDKKEEAA